MALEHEVDGLAAETGFSGVVRVERGGEVVVEKAYGLAHRGLGIANSVDTRFGLASGSKGFTALAVVSLVEDGRLELATTARSLLGGDLPLIAHDVTVEHLLAHTSGIGDYIDEEGEWGVNDYVMGAVHELVTTESFVPRLDGFPTKFRAGERFSYCNGGFVVLALLAERASGTPYHDLVAQRVCAPAGLYDTEFLRSDEPTERTALGYLGPEGLRTNLFHLPVRGNGDGGIYSTVADISSFWSSFFAGRIVPAGWVAQMVRPRSDVPEEGKRYGLGFWLAPSDSAAILLGFDAGVSFQTVHDPEREFTSTVISNTSPGAWPVTRYLEEVRLGRAD